PIVAGLAGELEAVSIGERHAEQLRLRALVPALVGIAVGCARGPGVGGEAGGGMARHAHGAKAATDVRGNGDAIAFLDVYYGRANFFDHAEGLMADDPAFDAAHAAFVKVEVRA